MIDTLEEKKAEEILLLDLQQVAYFTDYFIICNGSSNRMLRSLTHAVLETSKKEGQIDGRVEGQPESGWIAIDLGRIIIHLFSPEQRSYYQLEELWRKSKLLLRIT